VIEVSRSTSCSAFGEGLNEQQRRRTRVAVLIDDLTCASPTATPADSSADSFSTALATTQTGCGGTGPRRRRIRRQRYRHRVHATDSVGQHRRTICGQRILAGSATTPNRHTMWRHDKVRAI